VLKFARPSVHHHFDEVKHCVTVTSRAAVARLSPTYTLPASCPTATAVPPNSNLDNPHQNSEAARWQASPHYPFALVSPSPAQLTCQIPRSDPISRETSTMGAETDLSPPPLEPTASPEPELLRNGDQVRPSWPVFCVRFRDVFSFSLLVWFRTGRRT
jgi:hypothetical protein